MTMSNSSRRKDRRRNGRVGRVERGGETWGGLGVQQGSQGAQTAQNEQQDAGLRDSNGTCRFSQCFQSSDSCHLLCLQFRSDSRLP